MLALGPRMGTIIQDLMKAAEASKTAAGAGQPGQEIIITGPRIVTQHMVIVLHDIPKPHDIGREGLRTHHRFVGMQFPLQHMAAEASKPAAGEEQPVQEGRAEEGASVLNGMMALMVGPAADALHHTDPVAGIQHGLTHGMMGAADTVKTCLL